MKIKGIHKQGKKSDYQKLKSALSTVPIIDRSLVKANKEGVTKVSARLIDSQSMVVIPKGELLKTKTVEVVQKLAHENLIGPEGLVDVYFKRFRADSYGGVWPPCRATMKGGIVIGVEIMNIK